ncbi:MAG: GPR endopeptidase [Oscillospiraceae bacterium]
MYINSRTDLAVECVSRKTVKEGITQTKRGGFFRITEIIIENDDCAKEIGKPKGKYITMETDCLNGLCGNYNDMAQEFADELKQLIPDGNILVAGLGNMDITPDSLGVIAAENVIATRHLKDMDTDDEFFSKLRSVSVLISGVIGNTGIETAEIIKSVADSIRPSAIIAVDALACADISRLGKTIQISDTGICPGSGVQNKRKELSVNTLGIPVIAIGVPTVMDMYTIIENCMEKEADRNIPNMMVTPKDIDRLSEYSAKLIAMGINLALQSDLSAEDIENLQF